MTKMQTLRNLTDVLRSFLSTLYIYMYQLTRPLIKWTLHRTTGLCELQRICYCEPAGACRILGVGEMRFEVKVSLSLINLSEYVMFYRTLAIDIKEWQSEKIARVPGPSRC